MKSSLFLFMKYHLKDIIYIHFYNKQIFIISHIKMKLILRYCSLLILSFYFLILYDQQTHYKNSQLIIMPCFNNSSFPNRLSYYIFDIIIR